MSAFQFWNGVAADDDDDEEELAEGSCNSHYNLYNSRTTKKTTTTTDSSSQSTITSVKTTQQNNWTDHHLRHRHLQASSPSFLHHHHHHHHQDNNSSNTVVFSNSSSAASSSPPSAAMSSYLPSSDSLQTLYLMDPTYPGYGASHNSNTMLLFDSSSGEQLTSFANPNHHHQQHQQQQQQSLLRFPHPSIAITQTSLPHQSAAAHMAPLPSTAPDIYGANRHVYNWTAGNAIASSFQASESNRMLGAVQMDSIRSSSPYETRSLTSTAVAAPSFHHPQRQTMLLPSDVVAHHGLSGTIENLQASAGGGPGQILSLSLSSSQQPSMAMQQQIQQGGGIPLQQNSSNINNSFAIPSSSDNILLASNYQAQAHGNHDFAMFAAANQTSSLLQSSKYLKPTQELLNEVVSAAKKPTIISHIRVMKNQSNSQPSREEEAAGGKGEAETKWSGRKGEGSTMMEEEWKNSAMEGRKAERGELKISGRQEMQEKRAKLVGMREEVDRRYKQYLHQMQSVEAWMESAAGVGTATTYTALALEAISKHFRCLRDAMSGQIQAMSKALGEEEEEEGDEEGDMIGKQQQQMRQQYALMQQAAWRPQRGLPEHSVSVLRAWLFEHFLHPYPKDADKVSLARQTGLTRNQVSNWFINARVRLWKPMVEEMYDEETKQGNNSNGAEKTGGEGNHSQGTSSASEATKPAKQAKLSSSDERNREAKQAMRSYATDGDMAVLQGASPLLHQEGAMGGQDGASWSSSVLLEALKQEMKARAAEEEETMFREQQQQQQSYGVMQQNGGSTWNHNLHGYGAFEQKQIMSNKYSSSQQMLHLHSYPAANAGISLTLGLQHCEGPSPSPSSFIASSSSESYAPSPSPSPAPRTHHHHHHPHPHPHLPLPSAQQHIHDTEDPPVDYYPIHEALRLQNGKPTYANPNMLRHDFAV